MTEDRETLAVYDQKAVEYANLVTNKSETTRLSSFIDALPTGAHVLDYGCGPGHFAAKMVRAGFTVDAMDASKEMVRLCSEHEDVNVTHQRFDQFAAINRYDGIWASFSLLHAPKSDFPTHLAAIHKALKPGGLFVIGMKLGTGETRDSIGRFYAYYSQEELETHLKDAGFSVSSVQTGSSKGLAGSVDASVNVTAHA